MTSVALTTSLKALPPKIIRVSASEFWEYTVLCITEYECCMSRQWTVQLFLTISPYVNYILINGNITYYNYSCGQPFCDIYSRSQTFWGEFDLINMKYRNYSVAPKLFSFFHQMNCFQNSFGWIETSFELNFLSHTLSERVQIVINLMERSSAMLIEITES